MFKKEKPVETDQQQEQLSQPQEVEQPQELEQPQEFEQQQQQLPQPPVFEELPVTGQSLEAQEAEYEETTPEIDMHDLAKRYKHDNVTAEEAAYYEEKVHEARKLAKARLKTDKHVSVGTRIKRFFIGLGIFIALIALICVIGYFRLSDIAKDNLEVPQSESAEIAYDLMDDLGYLEDEYTMSKAKRRLVITIPFERTYYLYTYEVETVDGDIYRITIDSFTERVDIVRY